MSDVLSHRIRTYCKRKVGMVGTWWSRTGQEWKLHVVLGLLAANLLGRLFVATPSVEVALGVAGALAIVNLLVSARCEHCGSRVFWNVVRHQPIVILFDIYRIQTCPACGDQGDREG
jgi:hypothetical protein